jgi:hypothetical protein
MRDQLHKISGKLPIYFLTGEYDFACTPEMTERTTAQVKNSECIIFSGGHFPTSEDPDKFKSVVTPVLKKIIQNDPERRGQVSGPYRGNLVELSTARGHERSATRRVIDL